MNVGRVMHRVMHTTQVVVGGSGLLLGGMLYFLTPIDPYAVVNHPWQPQVLHLHVLSSPLLVFLLGIYVWDHALPYRRDGVREGRRSGVGLLLTVLPMIASGYLIQVSVETWWRNAWIVVHLATSLVWIGLMAVHIAARVRKRSRSRGRRSMPV